jgi:hypothetical protein
MLDRGLMFDREPQFFPSGGGEITATTRIHPKSKSISTQQKEPKVTILYLHGL